MANTTEIQSRIKSVQDTMKITNAMYMISSAKLKKARKRLADTEPYFYTLQSVIERIQRHAPDMEHPFFGSDRNPKKKKKVGYIVVTADKGLAGAYNHNVIKLAEEKMTEKDPEMLFVLGEMGRHYFEKKKINIDEAFHYTVQNPTMHRARVIAERILELYKGHVLDEVHLIFTRMINPVQCECDVIQLLPLKKKEFPAVPIDVHMEEIIWSPSPDAVLDSIVPNYLSGIVFGALVESYSSEQNSRMSAMRSATDSAKDMLRDLSMAYNRVRQAAITQEITEVISGAKAQKGKQ